MDKQMLKCDICGGTLKMQANREAVCESCGMAYSVESLREKFDGLKVSVTGSSSDVEQWKRLARTYISQHDYVSAEGVVKKILESVPSDEYANNTYVLLQEWKYLEIVNGTLIKYNGRVNDLVLPEGIRVIGESAFKGSDLHSITLCDTITTIEDHAFEGCRFLKDIILSQSLVEIGEYAFEKCTSLRKIMIPQSVTQIGSCAFKDCTAIESIDISNVETLGSGCFWGCRALKQTVLPRNILSIPSKLFASTALSHVTIPPGVKSIESHAFENCSSLQSIHLPDGLESIGLGTFSVCRALKHVSIPSTVSTLEDEAFVGCSELIKLDISQRLIDELYRSYCMKDSECLLHGPLDGTPWWDSYINQKKKENLRNRNVCQYCGGQFKGLFTKACSRCGKTKDY